MKRNQALRIGSREDLQIGVPRELWPRWKFVASWPPRLQSRQDYGPCWKCNGSTTLYLADDRIWRCMHKSWRAAILCFRCLRWLVDHPDQRMHVHPACADQEWSRISSFTRRQWEFIAAKGGDFGQALEAISSVDWNRWRRLEQLGAGRRFSKSHSHN